MFKATAEQNRQESSVRMFNRKLRSEFSHLKFDDAVVILKQPDGAIVVLEPQTEFGSCMCSETILLESPQEGSVFDSFPIRKALDAFLSEHERYMSEGEGYCSNFTKYIY